MKIFKLILLLVLTILVSCGIEDEVEKLGKTDCAVEFTNFLDQSEDDYQDLMIQPDSEGNQQSLEACSNRKLFTEGYLTRLRNTQNQTKEGCTGDEISGFYVRIGDRIQDLEEDMESTWNRCEEIFGGG